LDLESHDYERVLFASICHGGLAASRYRPERLAGIDGFPAAGLSRVFSTAGMWGLFVIPNVSKVSAPLIMFTPALLVYAALAWLVWMCSQSGDPGPNRYGPPPGNPEMTDEALPSEVPATAAPNPQRGPTRQMPSKTPRGFGRRGA
jgi:hypothetical protein